MIKRYPHQEQAIQKIGAELARNPRVRICVQAPTGAGKTIVMSEFCHEFYGKCLMVVHRRLLCEQTARRFREYGHDVGLIAAGHEWLGGDHNIAMIQTLESRYLKQNRELPPFDCLLIDEAHAVKAGAAQKIMQIATERGKPVIGFTATPANLGSHGYDALISGGTLKELRDIGLLVPAIHYAPDEPDLEKIKRLATGEYHIGELRKRIMTSTIYGRVKENLLRVNPELEPTLLFACDVAGSMYFAERLTASGIPSAHVDASSIWLAGEKMEATQENRERVIAQFKAGHIKVICNRFIFREGIDIPGIKVICLCTAFGLPSSYIQAAGRGLRASPGKDRLIILDHGGNYWRPGLGSVNTDRDWDFHRTENQVMQVRRERMRENKEPEPIVCPKCNMVRLSGPKCPSCQHMATTRQRLVVQLDGTLKRMEGKHLKPRKKYERPDVEDKWLQIYERGKRSNMTFGQAYGLFAKENGWTFPPRNLPKMPRDDIDWTRKVRDVPVGELH